MTRAEFILGLAEDLDAEHKMRQAKEYSDYRTKKQYSQRDLNRATVRGGAAVAGGAAAGHLAVKGAKKLSKHVQSRGGLGQMAKDAGGAIKRKATGEA